MLVEAAWEVAGCSSEAECDGKISAMEVCCVWKKGELLEGSGKPPKPLLDG